MNRAFLFLLFLLLAGKMCAQQVAGTLTLKEAELRFFRAQFIVDSRAVQYRHGTGAGITSQIV